ncbi:MAG TPA: DUF5655 domain-containing protein [Actinomycetota bacterium]
MAERSDLQTPEEYFEGHPEALKIFRWVRRTVEATGPATIGVSRSEVAFRRRRGFAWLWMPGRWLRDPAAEVVLSFALPRRDRSPRLKEVVEPRPGLWMHHLEVHDPDEMDDEVSEWLREAFEAAS